MARGRTETPNDTYLGCTLTLNNHSFQIDLIPVTIRNIDVIICMSWLNPHHTNIMYYEKAIQLNLPNNETLVIYDAKPDTNLQIVSCIKAQKYLHKRYHAFLTHVMDEKQEVKDNKDIPEVYNLPDVFPEDLLRIPHVRQVEFRIDLIPRVSHNQILISINVDENAGIVQSTERTNE
ncbi:hypothetical protein Lser_V15G16039 [Lactuca serriola]